KTGPPGPPTSTNGASSVFSQAPSSGGSRVAAPAGRGTPVNALYTRLISVSLPSGGPLPRRPVFRPAPRRGFIAGPAVRRFRPPRPGGFRRFHRLLGVRQQHRVGRLRRSAGFRRQPEPVERF